MRAERQYQKQSDVAKRSNEDLRDRVARLEKQLEAERKREQSLSHGQSVLKEEMRVGAGRNKELYESLDSLRQVRGRPTTSQNNPNPQPQPNCVPASLK